MQITTRFDIGYQFWVPRVIKQIATKHIIVNGKTYSNSSSMLVAIAKPKTLCKIQINVNATGTTVEYCCATGHNPLSELDASESLTMQRKYDPDRMYMTTESEAVVWAENYLLLYGEPYYG